MTYLPQVIRYKLYVMGFYYVDDSPPIRYTKKLYEALLFLIYETVPLSTEQQIYNNINKANKILICFKKDFEIDSLASALAMGYCLKKLDKQVTIISSDFSLNPKLEFMPMAKEVRGDLPALRKFVISIDVSQTKLKELSYDVKDGKLKIFITPKEGFFTPEQAKFEDSDFGFDLIFVLDSWDLESLGKIYDNNTEFFYDVPIINIDHHPENEHFGQINYVNLTATSTSEIIYREIESFGKDIVNEDLATLLLAGIISKTKNFKSLQITPQTLIATSSLIMAGGRREEVVKNLYQTKSVSDLKLWGRVLARLERDKEFSGLLWSTLTLSDFEKAGAKKNNLRAVMDEMMATIPEAEVVILFYEDNESRTGIKVISYNRNIDLLQILRELGPHGKKNEVDFFIGGEKIIEIERHVLDVIKGGLRNVTG